MKGNQCKFVKFRPQKMDVKGGVVVILSWKWGGLGVILHLAQGEGGGGRKLTKKPTLLIRTPSSDNYWEVPYSLVSELFVFLLWPLQSERK